MANERKFGEEEVNEILDLALSNREPGRPPSFDGGGLTLAELEEVGREVGVEPGRIAEAALAVASKAEVLPSQTFMGAPLSVGRVVDLPRALTDREWEVLVGEVRETFGARGHVTSHGGMREWTNGNLHVFLEPTATGDRLRLRTRKGTAMASFAIGAVGVVVGLVLATLFVFEDLGRASLVIPTLMGVFGGGTLLSNLIRLPRWAREREGQMEYIAGRAGALAGEEAPEEESS